MSLLGDLFSALGNLTGTGKAKLSEAKSSAPNKMGCYRIYYQGRLVYVGKAEDGIRKRFVQYYNGTTAHYPSAQNIFEHRDEITVSWQVLGSREACRSTERRWIEQYRPEWNKQSGWEHD